MGPVKDDSGKWIFDPSWPPAAQQQWTAAQADIAAEGAKLAAAEARREEVSVEHALLTARVQADEARRAAQAAAHALEDDRAWLQAQADHGGRVARLYVGNRWLILKANTGLQWESTVARAAKLAGGALEEGDDAKATKLSNDAFREGIFDDSLVLRGDDKERAAQKSNARALLADYPAAWPEVFGLREQLNRGPREAAGKGGAR